VLTDSELSSLYSNPSSRASSPAVSAHFDGTLTDEAGTWVCTGGSLGTAGYCSNS
jgi:hypothetical protein